MAERLCNGLQIRLGRFDSGYRVHFQKGRGGESRSALPVDEFVGTVKLHRILGALRKMGYQECWINIDYPGVIRARPERRIGTWPALWSLPEFHQRCGGSETTQVADIEDVPAGHYVL